MTADAGTSGTNAGNLAGVLILFAQWRPCTACGCRVLYVDERGRNDSTFTCGRCEERRGALGKECRPPQRMTGTRRPTIAAVGAVGVAVGAVGVALGAAVGAAVGAVGAVGVALGISP